MEIKTTEHEIEEILLNTSNKNWPQIISLTHEVLADLETPVSAFYKVCYKKPYSFLLESVEGGEKLGRYSFIGTEPILIFTNKNKQTILENTTTNKSRVLVDNPFNALKEVLQEIILQKSKVSNFVGFVGYFGYETVRWIEPKVKLSSYEYLPDACLTLPGKIIIFDHVLHKVTLCVNILLTKSTSLEREYKKGKEKLNEFISEFNKSYARKQLSLNFDDTNKVNYKCNYKEDEFRELIVKAKKHIYDGNIFQVVLSQKLTIEKKLDSFLLYRALRSINPSPYLFYLNFQGYEIVGSSPEVMVKCEIKDKKKIASLRPIAGTYKRGSSEEEDKKNIESLLADKKEKAEHLMLVDLARNDLGRVCKPGTINVSELMVIEKYSHVLHIVSQVEGELNTDKTSIDLLEATFPAGTLTGAPKVKAMEIINELEKEQRGPYGGCIGIVGFNDTINTCMTIRTFVIYNNKVEIQAGAGIVADSVPEKEYNETLRKGAALLKAISLLKF